MNTVGIVLGLLTFGCFLAINGQKGNAADDAAIRKVIGTLESGWNSHDMNVYMSVISSDANFINVNGWWWQGHEEIKQAHVTAHQTTFQFSKAEVIAKKVRFLKPDVAVAQAAWMVFGDVRNPAARHYMMTMVFNKRNGRWLLTNAQNGSREDRSSSPLTVNLTSDRTFQGTTAPSPGSATSNEATLQQTLEDVDHQWTKGDMQGLSRIYANDADVIDTQGQWHKGRHEIEKYLSAFRESIFKDGKYTSEVAKLALMYPDLAVATTRWTATSGSRDQSVRGMGIVVLQRDRKEWRIVAGQNTISRGNPPASK